MNFTGVTQKGIPDNRDIAGEEKRPKKNNQRIGHELGEKDIG